MASSLLPLSCNLSAEVSQVFGEHAMGKLDFYVDGELQWMLEFLVEGRELEEHVARFNPERGRYRYIRRKDWLVVDFRSTAPRPTELLPQVVYVLCSPDFGQATIVRRGSLDVTLKFSGAVVRSTSDL